MLGQYTHFTRYATEKSEYAINRFQKEGHRLLTVLDKQLSTNEYIAGNFYSIADIATYPWLNAALEHYKTFDVEKYPNIKKYLELVAARPAVQKGMTVF